MLTPAKVFASNPGGFIMLFVWLGMILLAVFIMRHVMNRCLGARPRTTTVTRALSGDVALRSKPVLTDAAARFFDYLEKAVDGEYLVWPELPLWTFINASSDHPGITRSFQNQINLKRVDFCLIHRHTRKVHIAIELDDQTHLRADRQRRDAFVEDVLKKAGVPVVRIPVANAYDKHALRRQLGLEDTKLSRRSANRQ